MKKSKTAIVNGSSRNDGHSAIIAQLIKDKTNGEVFHLADYQIGYFDYDNAHIEDDFIPFIETLIEYPVWVLVTPVYWYSMSAQMKTWLDRMSDILKWNKDLLPSLKKTSWYIASCGSDAEVTPGYFVPFRLSANYLDISYLGDVHLWKDNRVPIEKEVEQRIICLVSLINKTNSK